MKMDMVFREARDTQLADAISSLQADLPDEVIELSRKASQQALSNQDIERVGSAAQVAFTEALGRGLAAANVTLGGQELGDVATKVGELVKDELKSRANNSRFDPQALLDEQTEALRTKLDGDPRLERLAGLVFKQSSGPEAASAAKLAVVKLLVEAGAEGRAPSAEEIRGLPTV